MPIFVKIRQCFSINSDHVSHLKANLCWDQTSWVVLLSICMWRRFLWNADLGIEQIYWIIQNRKKRETGDVSNICTLILRRHCTNIDLNKNINIRCTQSLKYWFMSARTRKKYFCHFECLIKWWSVTMLGCHSRRVVPLLLYCQLKNNTVHHKCVSCTWE